MHDSTLQCLNRLLIISEMSDKNKPKKRTRSGDEMFLVGSAGVQIVPDKISLKVWTNQEVLQYIQGRLNLIKNDQGKPVRGKGILSFLSCPLKPKSKDARCLLEGGCESGVEPCFISILKRYGGWVNSGIPMMSDYAIGEKAKKLFSKQKALEWAKSKESKDQAAKREAFKLELSKSFDVSHLKAEQMIRADKKRSQVKNLKQFHVTLAFKDYFISWSLKNYDSFFCKSFFLPFQKANTLL